MFPACCFRQRTCVAQGLLNGVLSVPNMFSDESNKLETYIYITRM